MVIAQCGRRIDARNTSKIRFPPEHEIEVRHKIHTALETIKPSEVVCSAACGSDILTLEAAGDLKIRRRVVLPFNRNRFRETSVADRPGDWGNRYDSILNAMEQQGEKIVDLMLAEGSDAWTATNDHILTEAILRASVLGTKVQALIVWDGKSRGEDDVTAHFKKAAELQSIPLLEIITL
jgi:hypothetical protein